MCAQFPDLALEDAQARAAFRLLTSGVAPEVAIPLPSRWFRTKTFVCEKSVRSWPWLKLAWAVAVLALCATTVLLLTALVARAEPTPQHRPANLNGGYRNALRGFSLLPAPQQPTGLIVQFQQGGSVLATRPAGLIALNCSTGMSCSFSGTTFTLTSTGAGGNGCVPPGTPSRLLYDDGAGGCLDSGLTWTSGTSTATAPNGTTITYSGTGIINARKINNTEFTNAESLGKIPIGQGDGTAVWADPLVQGLTAHDAAGASTNPVALGGYASAAAPTDVSADTDIVRGWFLRNGAQATVLTAAGALIGGDATNGLDVDVTRLPALPAGTNNIGDVDVLTLPALPAGTNNIGDVDIASALPAGTNNIGDVDVVSSALPTGASTLAEQQTQTTALQLIDNIVSGSGANISQINGVAPLMGNGATGTGSPRVTIVNDNTNVPQIGGSATGSAVPAAARYIGGNGTGNLVGYLNCDNTAVYDASTNGSTQLVALTASQIIYVCGYQISQSTTTAVSVNLRYGTGTNCATSPVNITPSYPLQAATSTGPIGMVVMTPGFTGLKTAASNALCLNTNAAVSVQAIVWYTKF